MECFTKAHPESYGVGKKSTSTRLEDDYYANYNTWYFGTRQHFYNTSHFSPFTQDDYRSFDKQQDMDFQDEKDSGSFFDS
jgi:hypothetical protein